MKAVACLTGICRKPVLVSWNSNICLSSSVDPEDVGVLKVSPDRRFVFVNTLKVV